MQRVQHVQVGLLLRGADAALEQAVDDQADGVDRALGHGGVAALAPAADDGGTALPCLEGHALGLDECARADLHRAGSAVRHGVVGDAALERRDDAVLKLRADELAVEAALLAVADRELGVRRKAEGGHRVMLGVVVYVVHVRLLVGTQQGTHGVFQRRAAVLQVLQRVQAEDAGAFVVGHAAAQQPAVPHADRVGVGVPAVALGHNVGVGDGRQELLAVGDLARLGPADVAVGVEGVQAQLVGDLQRLGQRGLGAGAERCARLGCALHAGHGHQTGDVAQDVVAVFLHKGVNGRPARIVHVHKNFLLMFFYSV